MQTRISQNVKETSQQLIASMKLLIKGGKLSEAIGITVKEERLNLLTKALDLAQWSPDRIETLIHGRKELSKLRDQDCFQKLKNDPSKWTAALKLQGRYSFLYEEYFHNHKNELNGPNPFIKQDFFGPSDIIQTRRKEEEFYTLKDIGGPSYSYIRNQQMFLSSLEALKGVIEDCRCVGFNSFKNFSLLGYEKKYLAKIMIANSSHIYIFNSNELRQCSEFSKFIISILENEKLLKIGHRTKDELILVKETFNQHSILPVNYVDIGDLVANVCEMENSDKEKTQLKKIIRVVTEDSGKHQSEKNYSTSELTSDWDAEDLRQTQLFFACMNVYILVYLYKLLRENPNRRKDTLNFVQDIKNSQLENIPFNNRLENRRSDRKQNSKYYIDLEFKNLSFESTQETESHSNDREFNEINSVNQSKLEPILQRQESLNDMEDDEEEEINLINCPTLCIGSQSDFYLEPIQTPSKRVDKEIQESNFNSYFWQALPLTTYEYLQEQLDHPSTVAGWEKKLPSFKRGVKVSQLID